MSEIEDRLLYFGSPEVYAAVHAIGDIALRYRSHANQHLAREALLDDLIRFFAQYDRIRTDQVENLKAQLVEALNWSVKPGMNTNETLANQRMTNGG